MTTATRRISILLSLALGAALSLPMAASAASPQTKGSDLNAIAWHTTQVQVGDLATATAVALGVVGVTATDATGVKGAMASAAATSCKYAYWIAEGRNALGTVLFQYKEQVDWCENGTSIVGTPGRWTTPITPVPLTWAFGGESLFDGYGTPSSMTYAARGTFVQYAYPYPWPVGYSYPMVSIYGPRQRHSLR